MLENAIIGVAMLLIVGGFIYDKFLIHKTIVKAAPAPAPAPAPKPTVVTPVVAAPVAVPVVVAAAPLAA